MFSDVKQLIVKRNQMTQMTPSAKVETLQREPETERNKSELGTPQVSVMDSEAMADILFKNKQRHEANL